MDFNNKFNDVLKQSFIRYLETSARSNEKLKILHGAIAQEIAAKIDQEYRIHSLDKKDSKEKNVSGLFMNKNVDITISKRIKDQWKDVCGIAIKFVMSNYHQNSNNYFENMLGETANIRMNQIPYIQILILETNIPYFTNDGKITKWEKISSHSLSKYEKMSFVDVLTHLHVPNKIFLYVCNKKFDNNLDVTKCKTREEYKKFCYTNNFVYQSTNEGINLDFGKNVILNNMDILVHEILKVID